MILTEKYNRPARGYSPKGQAIFGKSPLFIIGVTVFLLALHVSGCLATERITVDFNKVITDDFLGINAVYHGFTYMPESLEQGMTDELRKIEMKRVKDSGIRVARTFYRPDWAMGQDVWTIPDWESVKMQALYRWLADMKELNVDVALNMGWWFARDVIWNRDQHLARYPDDLNNYKKWVSESLYQIIEKRGFDNVKYICMFTEPGNVFGDIPNGKKSWPYYKQVLQAVHAQLMADGRRKMVKLVGPNSTQAPRWLDKAASELNDVIDIYSSHNYNFTTYKKWSEMAVSIQQAVAATGKPFWVDEYGVQDSELRNSADYGTVLALANAAFINAGAQTSMLWILNDQYYPYPIKYITNGDAFTDGLHKWGLYPWLVESKTPRPAWYAFSMMSQLMSGDNAQTYSVSGGDALRAAAVGVSGDKTIMVVNEQRNIVDLNLNFSNNDNLKIYRYSYSDSGGKLDVGCERLIVNNDSNNAGAIFDHIPARGIIFYSNIDIGCNGPMFSERYGLGDDKNDNLAYGAKVTTSGHDLAHLANNVVDGSRLYGWHSKISQKDDSSYVSVDLGGLYQVAKVGIYPFRDGEGFPEDFVIDLSADGENWITVLSRKGYQVQDSRVRIFTFLGETARFVRLVGAGASVGGKGSVMKIAELKIYSEK